MKALIGKKLGMSQLHQDDGSVVPVTLIQAGPCTVTQVKNLEKDGYEAVQLGYGETKKLNKAQQGQFKAAGVSPRHIREFRLEGETEIGSAIGVDVFATGDKVVVRGTSKGKGFAGNVKRHNFNTGPKTHGSQNYRKPGSIGSMYPQKIFKGKRMAGQLGAERVSVKNLTVAYVDPKENVIGVIGAVPGPRQSIVTIEGVA